MATVRTIKNDVFTRKTDKIIYYVLMKYRCKNIARSNVIVVLKTDILRNDFHTRIQLYTLNNTDEKKKNAGLKPFEKCM